MHVLVAHAGGDTEEVGILTLLGQRFVVRPLQRVDDAVVVEGVVGGVRTDVISVSIEVVVQIEIGKGTAVFLELEGVRDGSEIMLFFILQVYVLLEKDVVGVKLGYGVSENE